MTARRYLESIDEAKRGIVLLHDRVGHVGSSYAIDVARALVPQLKARGYVFAAPVLGFSPLVRRAPRAAGDGGAPPERPIGVADVDGDRRADLCVRDGAGVLCATSVELAGSGTDLSPRTVFQSKSRWDLTFGGADWGAPEQGRSIQLADVDGDRRADLCGLGKDGIVCALATTPLAFAAPRLWSSRSPGGALLLGDVDGDGKADACARTDAGISCGRSTGSGFAPVRPWLAELSDAEGSSVAYTASAAIADVDGDGKGDVCVRAPGGIRCAISRRTSFARAEPWSSGDFGDGDAIPWSKSPAYWETIRFGDLNGDGRADVCGRGPAGIVCALSTGRGFTKATLWLRAGMTDADGWLDPARAQTLRLADVNGDARADLCADSPAGLVCGLAP